MSSATVKRKRARSRSAYQTHTTAVVPKLDDLSNVVDLAEKKLERLAAAHGDEQMRALAARILCDYVEGRIAVAWEDGCVPFYCFIRR